MNKSNTTTLVVNLDLEMPTANTVTQLFENANKFPKPIVTMWTDDWSANVPKDKPIQLVVLFRRQEIAMQDQLGNANAMIQRVKIELERLQITRNVAQLTLVDCGPNELAPLSNFFVVSSYLEELNHEAFHELESKVCSLSFEEPDSTIGMRMVDTMSEDFFDDMLSHTKQTLQMLNSNFGQGDLPDLPEGD